MPRRALLAAALPPPPQVPLPPTCQLVDFVGLEHQALQQRVADGAARRRHVHRILCHDLLLVLLQGVGNAVQDRHPVLRTQRLQRPRGAACLDGHLPAALQACQKVVANSA